MTSTPTIQPPQRNTTHRNATKREPSRDLPANQQQALGALLGGASVTTAAEVAGVDRTTVHRWLRADFEFRAALNGGRRELHQALQARLDGVAQRAVEAVSSAVDSGDPKTALALLKGMGLLDGRRAAIGSEDPEVLREEANLDERDAETDRLMRMIAASL